MSATFWRRAGLGLLVLFLLLPLLTGMARAVEPYVGIDLGLATPTEKYRETAGYGAALTGHAGLRLFTLADTLSVGIEAVPQFLLLDLDHGVSTTGRKVQSLFSLTGAPVISLSDGILEASFSGGGGIYTHAAGVIEDHGPGWFVAGGLAYHLGRGNKLGLQVRRDEASLRPVKGPSREETTFLTTSLAFTRHFLPPPAAPPVVAPEPEEETFVAPEPPAPTARRLVLRGVQFEFDRSRLTDEARGVLDEAVGLLKDQPATSVVVEGHTDASGSDSYNQALSERRAAAVADYLAAEGVDRTRLRPVGKGEGQPVADNETEEGRRMNRRVELRPDGE